MLAMCLIDTEPGRLSPGDESPSDESPSDESPSEEQEPSGLPDSWLPESCELSALAVMSPGPAATRRPRALRIEAAARPRAVVRFRMRELVMVSVLRGRAADRGWTMVLSIRTIEAGLTTGSPRPLPHFRDSVTDIRSRVYASSITVPPGRLRERRIRHGSLAHTFCDRPLRYSGGDINLSVRAPPLKRCAPAPDPTSHRDATRHEGLSRYPCAGARGGAAPERRRSSTR